MDDGYQSEQPVDQPMSMADRRRANLAKARAARQFKKKQPITETPEFKAAVETAAAEILARLLASQKIEEQGGTAAPVAGGGVADTQWARSLAMAMSEIADQGSGKPPRVAPEILEQRRIAAEKMQRLIIEARARDDVPVYQLKNKMQLYIADKGPAIVEPIWRGNDHIHYPTEIESYGVPNLSMIPVNPVAEEIFAAYRDSVGNVPAGLKFGADDDMNPTLAMTAGGVVVRGGAAQALFRSTGREEMGIPGGKPRDDMVGIRRNQPARTKQVNVLGTIHPPAEQNA